MIQSRRLLFVILLYGGFCTVGGIYLAEGSLHPARRALTEEDVLAIRKSAQELGGEVQDISITAADGTVLRACTIRPTPRNNNAVILLHGLGDNRAGMIGYAQLLLAQGYTVLMPDSRGHGASDGAIVTYGLLERKDIGRWFGFLQAQDNPSCIFGFGESMGAAQLLQSLASAHFCAVVAESPFAEFREIAYDRMGQPFHMGPWLGRTLLRPVVEIGFLRARLKYKLDLEQVSPEDSVAVTTVPILLIHGQADSNIPLRHSHLIHARNPKVQLWEVPRAGHCGAMSAAPREFEQRLLTWFDTHSDPHSQVTTTR